MYPAPPNKDQQGNTDRAIAKWLKTRKREDVVLMSKVSGRAKWLSYLRDSGQETRVRKSDIVESVDKSLRRLGTDYIDVLQVMFFMKICECEAGSSMIDAPDGL